MKTSMRHRTRVSGFTLIELLTVILIIGILMGLILGVAAFAQRKNLETRAKTDIETLCTALADYKMDIGEYPAEAGWVETLKNSRFLPDNFEDMDPWGSPYVYVYDNTADPPSETYRLLSRGEDGTSDPGQPETLVDDLEAGRY